MKKLALSTAITAWCSCFTATSAWAESLLLAIKDDVTKRPLAGVEVTIVSRDNEQSLLQSDSNGRALQTDLKDGLYEVTLKRAGYDVMRLPSVRVIAGKTTPITVTMFESKMEVEQVMVMGSAPGASFLDPVSTSRLDRESLRSAAGSGSDVLRALDGLPGLFTDGSFSSFTVRGNGPRNNLILVDGIPFDRVVHFSNSFGNVDDLENGGRYSVFAPNVIGGAEFQPGGWDAAYGGRAGSLLKLNVAEGNPETAAYTMRLDISGIEVGYDGPSGLHDETSVLFSARQLNFGPVFELIGADDFGEPKLTDVVLKTATEFNEGDHLSFLLIYSPEQYTRDIDHALASADDGQTNWDDLSIIETDTGNSLMALTWTALVGNSGELENRFYIRDYSEMALRGEALVDEVPFGTAPQDIPIRYPIIRSQNDETEMGWRFDYHVDNALGRIDTGFRWVELDLLLSRELNGNWNRFEYQQTDFRPSPDQKYIVLTPAALNTTYDVSSTQLVAYVDQDMTLGAIDIRVGLRYEDNDLLGDALFSPRVGMNWTATDKTSFTFTAGRYLQAPLFQDIAADVSNQLTWQKTDQLSLGLKYRYSTDIEFFVEPYYQHLTDLVVRQDGVNQTFANTGEGRGYGVDTAITRFFENGWSANFTYSYNDVRLKDQPDGDLYDADYSRPHSASMGGVWEINQHWKISGRVKYASGRPFDDFIIHENVLGEGELLRYSKEFISNNTERYDGYFSINARVDYRRAWGRTQLIAFLDIVNLTASDNPSDQQFNERTGENEINDGSLFPLVGFRFEW